MATQLVPYNTAMQLGSGFNSFTQTLCIDHAVERDADLPEEAHKAESEKPDVAQSVTYKTSIIEKTTDVTDEMNINGAFSIKYDQLKVDGKDSRFINTNKIKDSDVSIMVSVKVVNQTICDHSLTRFQPIPGIKDALPQRLIEIYGDCFISGWQEGGEFLAIISIKAKNREDAQIINANAKIAFSNNKNPPADSDKKELAIDLDAKFKKLKKEIAAENEVSVSVTWTGGGQRLKDPEKDWDFDTMKSVALRFADLCAKTPMRTHALLTKYTALRSFYTNQTFDLPVYDRTGTYTNVLQEAYLDYKSILGTLQVLAFDVSEGTKALVINPRSAKAVEQAKAIAEKASQVDSQPDKDVSPASDAESTESSVVDVPAVAAKPPAKVVTLPPLPIEEPFAPVIEGLEEARLKCRFMMNRIVQEIDNITIKPEIATDEERQAPYLSPFLFKMLLPLGIEVPAEATQAAQAVAAAKVDPDALAGKFTAIAG
ncbi:hypothetical protein NW762_010475 [Fusarium torreyae]|uniref:Uncharacterized protein n=1 Tax=Fusarium torreyae TaxID=1237075 RepID=A0A9W8RT19_9HYPO|nr:hypothetical protein NW762_010475 [Fusarium torreyae]